MAVVRRGMTVSPFLIRHVRVILELCLHQAKVKDMARRGVNCYSTHALPAYSVAVAAVEACLNESLLGELPRMTLKDSPLWDLSAEWLEKSQLSQKLILVPQLLFGQSLKRDRQPYQDMALLIRVRDALVHYKMHLTEIGKVPGFVADLDQRGIALRAPTTDGGELDYMWPDKLSCSEAVRWAHNTACSVVQGLLTLIPDPHKAWLEATASNFRPITEDEVIEMCRAAGLDTDASESTAGSEDHE